MSSNKHTRRAEQIAVDALDPIHKALAAHFEDVLKYGEEITVTNRETGEVRKERVKPSAAMLNQIRQFLKDNGVEAAATSQRMKNIVEGLPFAGDSDDEDDQPQQGVTH